MTASPSQLERRYRRLLRAYPAGYRAERGDEIVETYLRTVAPGRRWPTAADGGDVLAAGLRQHLRHPRWLGPRTGLQVAAVLALTTATALAAGWLVAIELRPFPVWFVASAVGPFQSLGALVWLAWLLVAVAAATAPRRVVRSAVGAATALTVALIPAAALTPYDRPPLLVLAPQVLLGLTALGWPDRPGRAARLFPAVGALAGLALALAAPPAEPWYRRIDDVVLAAGGGVLLIGGVAAGVGLSLHSRRGWWAAVLLLPAVAFMVASPLVQPAGGPVVMPGSGWSLTAGVVIGTAITGVLACARSGPGPVQVGSRSSSLTR